MIFQLGGEDGNIVRSLLKQAILLIGQSPMSGYDTAASLTGANIPLAAAFSPVPTIYQRTTRQDPIVWSYYSGDTANAPIGTGPSTYGTVSPHFYSGVASDCVGPEISLARDLDTASPNRYKIVKFTSDGSCLATDWLNPAYPTGGPSFANQLLSFVAAAGVTIVGIHWEQGHNDAILTANASAYAANLAIWFAQLRSNYGNVPITFGQLMAGVTTSPYTFRDTIRAQQVIASQSIPYVTLINDDDLTLKADVIHPNADGSIAIGHRIATAYQAAIVNTTLSGTLGSSANPVVTSTAFSYTFAVSNTGAQPASNVSAVTTLPAGVVYGSSSGTGWTISVLGQVVTATRATLAVGAAPIITINVTSPSTLGTNPIVCTGTVVASNVVALASPSKSVTLSAPPVTADATSGLKIPQTGAEWTALAVSGVAAADSIWRCQEASGVLADSGANATPTPLTLSGTGTYANVVTGWASKGLATADGVNGSWKTTGGAAANPASASQLMLGYILVSNTPTVNRDVMEFYASGALAVRITVTPRTALKVGGGATTGTNSPVGSVRPFVMKYDHTGLAVALYTDQEKLIGTYAAQASISIGLGGFNAASPPTANYLYAAAWYGAAAEMSDATIKAMLQALGWTIPWT